VAVLAAHLEALRLRGHTPGTIYARRRALARMAAAIPVPLLEATGADLRAWRAGLAVTPDSVRSYCSHAKHFYAWAVREGLRPDSPAGGLDIPRRVTRLPRPIGEDDLMHAVTNAPPRVRPWLVLAGWAGLRACEIAGLRRERILDTARPPVLLVASDATKGRRERAVPMAAFVAAELRLAHLPRTGIVFRRPDGRPNTPSDISHVANRYLRSVGVDATLHQLRHRFATAMYIASGYDLRMVQDLLGHKDPSSTALYAAWNRAGAADVVNALPAPQRLSIAGTR
jgi:integrase/recombinase XerC